MRRKIRILVAKPGLDGHDRGAKVIARAFRDAGMEVIYTGLHQSPEQIINAAIQEDVDVIGLSILSGAHIGLSRKVVEGLRKKGVTDKVVIVGGTIDERDVQRLKAIGVAEVFGPGSPIDSLVNYVQGLFVNDRGPTV
jgi:methylmalonyl-CoA mutase C-terminal domain/subunit